MRIFIATTICFLILLGAPLFAAELYTASWEQEADAALWTERVIESVQSDEVPVPANAFCNEEVFRKLGEMRDEASAVVEKSIVTGEYTVHARIAANLLQQIQDADVSERIFFEDNILMNSRYGYDFGLPMKHNRGITSDTSAPFLAAIHGIAITTGSSNNLNTNKQTRCRRDVPSDEPKINLNYSLLNGTIDYFKLILYQWEDNPRNKYANITKLTPPFHSNSVNNLFTQQNNLRNYNHKNNNLRNYTHLSKTNINNTSGATS